MAEDSEGWAARDEGEREALPVPVTVLRAAADQGAAALAVDLEGAPTVRWLSRSAADLLQVGRSDVLPLGPLADDARSAQPAARRPVPGQRGGTQGSPPADWRDAVAVLLRGGPGPQTAQVSRPDGSCLTVEVGLVPLSARAGGSLRLITLHPVGDDTAAARRATREAEHRFSALAERAPVGIFLSEAGLRLGFVNDRFVTLAGVDSTRLLGTGWLDVVHREDLPTLYDVLAGVLSGKHAELTLRLTPVGDGQRWVQLRLAPVTTPRRAAGFIGTLEDITARRAWEEQLSYQANHDPLTGLANRRRLVETLSELLASRRGPDRDFAVVFCDLDGFKQVNDRLGHDAGDRVLIEVARRLARTARAHDLLARVAGDEFVVVLRQVHDAAQAQVAAARHLAALAEPLYVGGHDVRVSASLGVALPTDTDTPETLLRAADQLMYEAKASGPGQYRLIGQPAAGSGRPGLEVSP